MPTIIQGRTADFIIVDELSRFATPEEERLLMSIIRDIDSATPEAVHDHPQPPSVDTLTRMYRDEQFRLREYHSWMYREQDRYPLHYSVEKLLHKGVTARDWKQLLLEWPHVSVNDPARVAYTRSPEHGEADRQTVTSLGRYLRRHFAIPDHEIRDVCAQAVGGQVQITREMDRMVWAVQTGPGSCMQDCQWDERDHPYNVYATKYGWGLAYRAETDEDGIESCVARALVYEGEDDCGDPVKCFVRSYRKTDGYSHSDECLEATLKEMGYRHVSYWPQGARLARIEYCGDIVLPYIDGGVQNAWDHGTYLTIDRDGSLAGTQTNGYAEGHHCGRECEHCGDDTDEDDMCTVGNPESGEEREVCSHCRSNNFTFAIGENGARYYERDEDVIEDINGTSYVEEYLGENDIVRLADGDYAPLDECVQVPDGDYYPESEVGEGDVVELAREYTDAYGETYQHALTGDCIQTRGGDYYHENDEDGLHYIEAIDEWVHDDDLSDDERVDLGLPVPMLEEDGQVKLPIYKDYPVMLALPAPQLHTV